MQEKRYANAYLFSWLERQFLVQTFDEDDIEVDIQEIRRLLDEEDEK